jgi:glycosyltransferase involved in cell wall biosynthesis
MGSPAQDGIVFILPAYNKFGYARMAALSFLKYTERPKLILLVDDASPYYHRQDWNAWRAGIPEECLIEQLFTTNGGLTRSWNWGLTKARELNWRYTICGNSDIRFTPGWEHGLIHHVDRDYALVGPVTNAPGVTNGGNQQVARFCPAYDLARQSDSAAQLAKVAGYLRSKYPIERVDGPMPVNGFFMFAQTAKWWEGAFDATHVFDPSKKMVGNEDELQKRWQKRGWKTGFVPSSFIFHYRAVSRGDSFRVKGFYRTGDIGQEI